MGTRYDPWGEANLSDAGYWGATLSGVACTSRSVFGPELDARSLAQVLIQAGAVRAMELDINPQWVSFCYYTGPGSGGDLISGMFYGPSHWLSGNRRDFIAVFTR